MNCYPMWHSNYISHWNRGVVLVMLLYTYIVVVNIVSCVIMYSLKYVHVLIKELGRHDITGVLIWYSHVHTWYSKGSNQLIVNHARCELIVSSYTPCDFEELFMEIYLCHSCISASLYFLNGLISLRAVYMSNRNVKLFNYYNICYCYCNTLPPPCIQIWCEWFC